MAGIGEEVFDLDAPVRGEGVFDAGTGGMRVLLALLAVKKVGTPPMVPTIVFGQALLWLPKATPPVP